MKGALSVIVVIIILVIYFFDEPISKFINKPRD